MPTWTRLGADDLLQQLREGLPLLREWVTRTNQGHSAQASAAASLRFPRLPAYFAPELLDRARCVVVEALPKPPLAAWGFDQFRWFEDMPGAAITYEDTYDIRPADAGAESLHAHELVHVVQWQTLGFEQFVMFYAIGLTVCGYRGSVLEALAYDHQALFESGGDPYPMDLAAAAQMRSIFGPL